MGNVQHHAAGREHLDHEPKHFAPEPALVPCGPYPASFHMCVGEAGCFSDLGEQQIYHEAL